MKLSTHTLVLVAAGVWLLAGCGPDEAGTTTTTTKPVVSETSDTNDTVKSDQSKLQSLLLTKKDVPNWYVEEQPPNESEDDKAFDDRMNRCAGLSPSSSYSVAEASGPTYYEAENDVVSQARSVTSEAFLQREYMAFARPSAFACLSKEFGDTVLGDRLVAANGSVKLSEIPGFNNDSRQLGLRFAVVVNDPDLGPLTSQTFDFIQLRKGRFEVSLLMTSLREPVAEDRARWVALLQSRLAKLPDEG